MEPMDSGDDKLKAMLEKNVSQKEYYEFDKSEGFSHGGTVSTKLWSRFRGFIYRLGDDLQLNTKVYDLHRQWLSPLNDIKVFELGCHMGNELSIELAKKSSSYVGLDLSRSGLDVLEEKLKNSGITNYKLYDMDFLSTDFQEKDFDLVNAIGVLHHFKYFDIFLEKLDSILKPGALIFTLDPLNTYLPIRMARSMYRPFQKDKDWEYPFTKDTIKEIGKRFEIVSVIGILGKLKFAIPLYFFNKKYALKKAEKWMKEDMEGLDINNKKLWKCLRISMLLRKKG